MIHVSPPGNGVISNTVHAIAPGVMPGATKDPMDRGRDRSKEPGERNLLEIGTEECSGVDSYANVMISTSFALAGEA
jgi:hypothetical protein